MILSAIAIFIVIALGWVWGSRGFFSSLLHMACVLVAGAVAFAFWETVSYGILKNAGNTQWMIDIAWGVGLGLPFAVALIVIRKSCDLLVPANCDLDGVANLVGGIACGVVSGTITAGIFVISIGFLRLSPDFAGHQAVRQEPNGAPVINAGLLFPVDRLTAWAYGYASEATLRTSTPLAKWRPTLTVDGAMMRYTFGEGTARHAVAPKGVELKGHFTVGKETKHKVADLLNDGFAAARNLKSSDVNADEINSSSMDYRIEAYVVSFSSAAREKEGSVVIGNTQVELVCRDEADTESISVFPVAVSSKAEPVDADDKRIRYGRWRFERPNTYFRSVGGTDNALMGFEFLVKRGYQPIALYVKGVRVDLTRVTFPGEQDFADIRERDKAITNGKALGGEPGVVQKLDWEPDGNNRAVVINTEEGNDFDRPIRISDTVPANRNASTVLSKDNIGGLKLNDERQIIGGEEKYKLSDLQKNRGIDSKLQVRQFYAGEDTVIVQVNFGKNSPLGPVLNGAAAEANGAITLRDHRGEEYPCIGFVYYDNQLAHIRFTPEATIDSKDQLPFGGPSSSRPDQAYILLYRVGKAVKLTEVRIGETKIAEIKPELLIRK